MSLLCVTLALGASSSVANPISIIPEPLTISSGSGCFYLTAQTNIVATGSLRKLGYQLRQNLEAATGYPLPLVQRGGRNSIRLRIKPSLGKLGNEGYALSVSPEGVEIAAFQPAGVFYGIQSLRQLLPADIFRRAKFDNAEWAIPCVSIEDRPRFGWRGMHVDVGRHFMPKEFLFKFIDLIALHKMNVLHLHLTEDQGWRIEIKKYPKLTAIGAWRKETMAGHYEENRFDGIPYGGYYTQEDIREIVRYAEDRYINVMPEIEMPGHSQAAIAAYPEFGNTGKQLEVETKWGVSENVFNVDDRTVDFLKDVLDEVLELFPSKFVHIGGDEVPKTQGHNSPGAQAKMKKLGLKDEHELQSWFVEQMDQYLAAKGRRLVGWDEILEGGLASGATVMSWRGQEGGIAAAKAGHDVVMTPGDSTYFDHYQSRDRKAEGVAIGGYLPLEHVYAYEPVPKELTPEEAKHVLGAQGQLWTEYIADPKRLEYMAFPRTCAISEVLWTEPSAKNYAGFLERLGEHLKRLSILDVNYRKLDQF